jgi:transcriptional regulator with XRE-family HTH domain
MTKRATSVRRQRRTLANQLRARGRTWVEISAALRDQWPELTALAATRIAHGWTQQDAADEWNRRWPDQTRSPKEIGLWENWPTGSGRRPSLTTLDQLAELYHCSIADLVADVYNYRHLDRIDATPDSATRARQPWPATASGSPVNPAASSARLAEQWHSTSGVEQLARTVEQLEAIAAESTSSDQAETLRYLGYAHEALGESAFDQLRLVTAVGHFQQMHQLGVELDDQDLIALALTHQADIARRRRRYPIATRLLDLSATHARNASTRSRTCRWQILARTHAERGERNEFLAAIDHAESCANEPARHQTPTLPLTTRDIRQERAHGLTLLGNADVALTIYNEHDPSELASSRDRTNLTIIWSQALAHAGELAEGTRLAIVGLSEARAFGSARFVSRVERMHDRLTHSHPTDPHVAQLGDALAAA